MHFEGWGLQGAEPGEGPIRESGASGEGGPREHFWANQMLRRLGREGEGGRQARVTTQAANQSESRLR